MTEQSLFILAALAGGELHGYAVAQDAEELSEGRVRLSAGTLYGALTRLTSEGLVEHTHDDVVDGRRRRYYRITGAGRTALASETARIRSLGTALASRSALHAAPGPRPA